jgi:hypothetical protein
MNAISAKQKIQLSTDPVFTIGSNRDMLTAADAEPREPHVPVPNPYLPPYQAVPQPHDFEFTDAPDEQLMTLGIGRAADKVPDTTPIAADSSAPQDDSPAIRPPVPRGDDTTNPTAFRLPSPRGAAHTESHIEPAATAESAVRPPRSPPPVNVSVKVDRRGRLIPNYSKLHTVGQTFHISMKKALSTWKSKALAELIKEMHQLAVVKRAFRPVRRTTLSPAHRKNIIRSSMFLKEKFQLDGQFEKLKARLVAGGDMQDRSLYGDVSLPTVSSAAVFLTATIAAGEKRKVKCVDFTAAYPNANMGKVKVHVRLDPFLAAVLCQICLEYAEFLEEDGTMVTELDKASTAASNPPSSGTSATPTTGASSTVKMHSLLP